MASSFKSGEAVVVNVGARYAFANFKKGTEVSTGPINQLFIQPSSMEEIGQRGPTGDYPPLFNYLEVGDIVRFKATYQEDGRTQWKAKDLSVAVIDKQNKGKRAKPIEGLGLITFIDNASKKFGFIKYQPPSGAAIDIWFGAKAIQPTTDDISLMFSVNEKVRFRAAQNDPNFEGAKKQKAPPKCAWRAICVVAKKYELPAPSAQVAAAMQSLSSRPDSPSSSTMPTFRRPADVKVVQSPIAAVKWGQDRLVTEGAFFDQQSRDGSESSSTIEYGMDHLTIGRRLEHLRQSPNNAQPSKENTNIRNGAAKNPNQPEHVVNPFNISSDSADAAGNSDPAESSFRSAPSRFSHSVYHSANTTHSNGEMASGVVRRPPGFDPAPPSSSSAHLVASVGGAERPMEGGDRSGYSSLFPDFLADYYRVSKECQQLKRVAHRFLQITEDECPHCQL